MAASQTIVLKDRSSKVAYGIVDRMIFQVRTDSAVSGEDDAVARQLAAQAGAQRIPLGEMAKAQVLEDAERSIRVSSTNKNEKEWIVETGDEVAQQRFTSVLRAMLPSLKESRGTTLGAALGGPLFVAALVAILSFVVYSTAQEIDAGTYKAPDRAGKARLIAKLSFAAAEMLGTTGAMVTGVVLLALCVAWLIYELKHVCNVLTLKP